MPICTSNGKVIFFAHIPKTGGSSIESYLRRKGELTLFGEPKIDGIHMQHLTRKTVSALTAVSNFDYSFAVVRSPVSRIVSEFFWRSTPLKPLQRLMHPTSGSTRRRIKVRDKKQSLTFAEWVPLVLAETRDTPSLRDNHMRPQVEFLAKGDKIFLFEQGLDPVVRWIDEVTDGKTSGPVERLKSSIYAKPQVDETTCNLIESFYAEDVALHHEMQAGSSTF